MPGFFKAVNANYIAKFMPDNATRILN